MIQRIDDYFVLNNGVKMPGFGFGTWQSPSGKATIESVKNAIKVGYRNIDTAAAYGNEESVGEGIRQAMDEYGVMREELFISTKLWNDHRRYDLAMGAFDDSMKKLKLDYLDLYMIHWPAVKMWHDNWRTINHSTWRAFEELYHTGAVKAIGVSNFLTEHIQALLEDGEIPPTVNQIEYHPGFGQIESADFCRKNGIVVEAWSPFGTGAVLQNEVLTSLAEKYKKTPAQICLRWLVQKEIVPLPKSVHETHILSNALVFDFSLSQEDMLRINAMPYCGGMRFDPASAKS